MERKGKHFELGYPNIERGIVYGYPNQSINYQELLIEKKDELGELLIPNLRKYIEEFEVRTHTSHYPYLQKGEKGLVLHLGDGGRWMEVWDIMGCYFMNAHNLDAYRDRAVGFNIGADVLEHLDPEILAPRMLIEDGEYVMRYPLPDGLDLIPIDPKYYNKESLERIYKLIELKTDIELIFGDDYQEVRNSDGVFKIKGGFCEGREFKKWAIPKASWVLSRLMVLCGD